ncbi:hypothetical protein CEN47_14390 [Fischerella thermalis CCMEE 5319]|nr:hypothetical protein CEN47_14390 [Fischerella thermalis CCMEE 5319]
MKHKTVLFHVRNFIIEQPTYKEIVAEEMWLWGHEGDVNQREFINKNKRHETIDGGKAQPKHESSGNGLLVE